MLDINNYSFQYKAIGHNKWECLVINNDNKLKFGLICFSPEQPKNEEIFNAFADKNEFRKHFFLDCDVEIITTKEDIDTVITTKEDVGLPTKEDVDLSPKTNTLESSVAVAEKQI